MKTKYHVEVRYLGEPGAQYMVKVLNASGKEAWHLSANDRNMKSTLKLAAKKRRKLEAT